MQYEGTFIFFLRDSFSTLTCSIAKRVTQSKLDRNNISIDFGYAIIRFQRV